MPNDLILIRHGESEGNVARRHERAGDASRFTDSFVTTPGRRWSLTETGKAQAAVVGAWLSVEAEHWSTDRHTGPTRFYTSPFTRAIQTAVTASTIFVGAAQLELRVNRSLRERDWGDIDTMPTAELAEGAQTVPNARRERVDPMYWRPPGGESIADVAENRVRNFLDTLHRECSGGLVLASTHGEFMAAARLILERADDDTYEAWERDPDARLRNGHVLHYSRVHPTHGTVDPHLTWHRQAHPRFVDGSWAMQAGAWEPIQFGTWEGPR